ncbi:MAG TPA: TrmH family RNA methyltransferase [Firmicutes bacterium]|nr:TrmH family RNA methyltransferase [Bacillota bacterium]
MNTKIQKYTKGCGLSYTAGFFPTLCMIEKRPEIVKTIYVAKEAVNTAGFRKIESLLGRDKLVISDIAVEKLGSKGNDHVIGVFATQGNDRLRADTDHVVMVNPMDMGNIGNAMRTMLAFGYRDLALITPCGDYLNPKAIRASMGAFFSIRCQEFSSFDDYIKAYPRPFYPFILQTDRTLSSIQTLPAGNIAIVFGNEATGLPPEFRIPAGIRIEQSDDVDSLNLTTSIAVALHDFRYRIKRV